MQTRATPSQGRLPQRSSFQRSSSYRAVRLILPLFLGLSVLTGCNAGVNRSLSVKDGESSGGLNTVNGSIRIGRDATVDGGSRSVNGSIVVRDGSKVGGLATVNGSIDVNRNVSVDGDLESVNGSIKSATGTTVDGDIATVNGRLRLAGTTINGKIKTHNGSISLSEGSRVKRDIVVARKRGVGRHRSLNIEIQDGAIVEGNIIVEDPERKVTVYLEDDCEVIGEIRGAEVVRRSDQA